MTDTRDKFELKISMEYEQPPCLDRDGDGYDDSYVDNAWWGWQAATEQSQKEIEALQAREKVLVDLLGECVDTVRNEYNEMLELYSIYPHKQYDIQCQKELLNGIEQALANVRGEVK